MDNKKISSNEELSKKIMKLEFCVLLMLNLLESNPQISKQTLGLIRDILTEKGVKNG